MYEHGTRLSGSLMTVFFLPNTLGRARLGIAATRKIGSAVIRNRAKRRVRDLFRRHRSAEPVDMVVIPRRDLVEAPFERRGSASSAASSSGAQTEGPVADHAPTPPVPCLRLPVSRWVCCVCTKSLFRRCSPDPAAICPRASDYTGSHRAPRGGGRDLAGRRPVVPLSPVWRVGSRPRSPRTSVVGRPQADQAALEAACRGSPSTLMEKRVLVAVVLSFLVLYIYQAFLAPPPPKPVAEAAAVTQPRPGQRRRLARTPAARRRPSSGGSAASLSAGAAVPAPATLVGEISEREVRASRRRSSGRSFTNRGGRVTRWELKKYHDEQGQLVDLVPPTGRGARAALLARDGRRRDRRAGERGAVQGGRGRATGPNGAQTVSLRVPRLRRARRRASRSS